MKRRSHAGFTLVELMIVVAIIGILAAVALPSYMDYAKRAKMSEVMLATSVCRNRVTEAFMSADVLPAAGNWGCEQPGPVSQYVAAVEVNNAGAISVTVGTGIDPVFADGKVLTLVPFLDATTPMASTDSGKHIYRWVCGSSSVTPATTVDRRLLPGSCRS